MSRRGRPGAKKKPVTTLVEEDLSFEQRMNQMFADTFAPIETVDESGIAVSSNINWEPNPPDPPDGPPNPQQVAFDIDCHETLFGGQAGGGKSDFLLGLALMKHHRSIIFRRELSQMQPMIMRSKELIGENGRFNENRNIWREMPGGKTLQFGGVQHEKDKRRYQGHAHDLKCFDEITELTKTQYQFLKAWARTSKAGQKVRVVATCNPPTDAQGAWVVEHWAAWLDPLHHNPAKSGEIRWYITVEGEDREAPDSDPIIIDGEEYLPNSRTFIRSRLKDNPHYGEDYERTLHALPEPLRSQLLKGDFSASIPENEFQAIPTEWEIGRAHV